MRDLSDSAVGRILVVSLCGGKCHILSELEGEVLVGEAECDLPRSVPCVDACALIGSSRDEELCENICGIIYELSGVYVACFKCSYRLTVAVGVLIVPLIEHSEIKRACGEGKRGRIGELTVEVVVIYSVRTVRYICVGVVDYGVVVYVDVELFVACTIVE